MKKLLFCFVLTLIMIGFSINSIAAEKQVYTHMSAPADKYAQAARIDLRQLQIYFKKKQLAFAMMDQLHEDNIVLALHSTRKLMITNPRTKENVGYITIRFSQSKLRVYCSMNASEPAAIVCNNLEIANTQFLDSPKNDVVEVISLELRHSIL